MITLDTSALFALLNRQDPDHLRVREALSLAGHPYLVPMAILAEIAYLVEQRMPVALRPLLADLESGAYSLDCGEGDLSRIGSLLEQYDDLSLGVADAAVIACAERNGGAVLTLDMRDFGPVARAGIVRILPEA